MGSFPDCPAQKNSRGHRFVLGSFRPPVTMGFSGAGLTGLIEVSFNQFETLAQQSRNADARFFGALLQDLHLIVIDSAGNDELLGVGC